jgi:hypothetical protein
MEERAFSSPLCRLISVPVVAVDDAGNIQFRNSACLNFLRDEQNLFRAQTINQAELSAFLQNLWKEEET